MCHDVFCPSCTYFHQKEHAKPTESEHDKALQRIIIELLTDHTELFKQFSDNPAFRKWLSDLIFASTDQGKISEARQGGYRYILGTIRCVVPPQSLQM